MRSTRAVERLPLALLISGVPGDDLVFREAGVEIVRRARVERVRWVDISEVRTLGRSSSVERYRLGTYRGQVHELCIVMPDGVSAFAQLHEPTLRHLLAAGASRFGPLRADAAGLRSERAELAWNRVVSVAIEGERLIVLGRDDTGMEFALADVPNPHVLVAMARLRCAPR